MSEVALWQSDAFEDTHIGTDKDLVSCNDSAKWSMVNARNNLYIKLTILYPHRDSKTYTIKGTVAFNGGTVQIPAPLVRHQQPLALNRSGAAGRERQIITNIEMKLPRAHRSSGRP